MSAIDELVKRTDIAKSCSSLEMLVLKDRLNYPVTCEEAAAELARLQAIAEAAALMAQQLRLNENYKDSCLRKDETHVPVSDLFTTNDAICLNIYEKAVKS